MRRVIIESPYAGDIERNVAYARACMRDSVLRNEAPIASHLLYTQPGILRDEDPEERALGIKAGLAWREVADVAIFYIDRGYSMGMLQARDWYASNGFAWEERTLPDYESEDSKPEAIFTLRAWGEKDPTPEMLADELGRIAELVRGGMLAGEALVDEDFAGQGWWDQTGFVDDDEMVTCSCGAEVDTSFRGECDECGKAVVA